MARHHCNRAVAQRVDERHRIANHVEDSEGIRIGVVGIVPTGGAAKPAHVGRDRVIAGQRQRQHHLPPAIGKLRETVQKKDRRTPGRVETCLQKMHRESVDIGHSARTDARRDRSITVRWQNTTRTRLGGTPHKSPCSGGRRRRYKLATRKFNATLYFFTEFWIC